MDCPVSRYNRYIIPLFPLSKPHQFFIPLMVEPSSFSSSPNNSRGKKETARQPGREHLNLKGRRKGKWNGRKGSLNHRVRSRSYSSRTRREREREREYTHEILVQLPRNGGGGPRVARRAVRP